MEVSIRGVLFSIAFLATTFHTSAGPLELIQDIYGSYPPNESPIDWHRAKRKLSSIDDLPLSSETLGLLNR